MIAGAALRLPGAAPLTALGRTVVPFSALRLIDWPGSRSEAPQTWPSGAALGREGAGTGGGSPRQAGARRAGPGENLEAGLDPERAKSTS